jgi:hypothetical protein
VRFDDPSFTCTQPGPGGEANYISAPEGTRLPVTPKFNFAASGRYEFPIFDGTGHGQAVISHRSSAASDIRTLIFAPGTGDPVNPAEATGRLDDSTVVDFSFGIEWESFSVEAFLANAFDERAQLTRFQECGQCFQRPYIVTNRPQTFRSG